MTRICWGHSTGCFIYRLFYLSFKWSVKSSVAKILLAIWEMLLLENSCHCNSYRFIYKSAFILFFSFLADQKEESGFQQVGGMTARNILFFVYIKSCSTSKSCRTIDFYRGIFLHVIPVRIIVPWIKGIFFRINYGIRRRWYRKYHHFHCYKSGHLMFRAKDKHNIQIMSRKQYKRKFAATDKDI